MEFNLIDEPWIPVIWHERPQEIGESWSNGPAKGQPREKRIDDWRSEIGIRDALNFAGQIREIYDTSPLVTFGIHRLLLAILHAANVHGENADIQHGADKYLDSVVDGVRMRDRFDLFNTKHPFLQNAQLSSKWAEQKNWKGASTLYMELPKGSNIAHFRHQKDGLAALTPAACARGILLQSTHPGQSGRGFKDAINHSTPVYAIPLASTLDQTLRLNLHSCRQCPAWANARQASDAPVWENKPRKTGAVGYLEGLFWPARAVLLQQPQNGFVGWIIYDQGQASEDINAGPNPKRFWNDPHATVVRPKKDKRREWTRLLAPKPLDTKGDWHAWRQVLSDISDRGKPLSIQFAAARASAVEVISLAHNGKAKFYPSSALRLPAFNEEAGEQSKAFFKAASDAANSGLWANNPKRKANRETYRPLAGFNPAEFEFMLFQKFQRENSFLSEEQSKQIARSVSITLYRVMGLPWQKSTGEKPSYPTRSNDLDDDRLKKFLARLADKKRIPLVDLALLRRAKVHTDKDAAPLTDLLNEHVREFKVRRRTAWMIARLFAHDPLQGKDGNMGEHMGSLLRDVSGRNRERLKLEFEHLLHTPFGQLEPVLARWIMRLRQARRSKLNIPSICWVELYQDLDSWGEEVRTKWHNAFR